MFTSLLPALVLTLATAEENGDHKADTPDATPSVIEPVDARRAPTVRLLRVATGKRYTLDLFDDDGHLREQALTDLRGFLSDRRRKIDHPIHWRLATLLVAVAAHFPDAELQVVSGYRHVNRHHKKSRHTRGHAIDFRVTGVDNRELFDLLRRSFAGIGVGYYPNSTFVHLDVRPDDALWVDYSGVGQTPCYSRKPRVDLRSGQAERLSYDQAIAAGCRHPRTSD